MAADIGDAQITASKIKDGEVVEGNGRMQSTALTLSDGAGFTTLLSVPGLGALRASCANGVATTQWQNTAPGAVTVVNQTVLRGGPTTSTQPASPRARPRISPPTRARAARSRSCGRPATTRSAGDRVSTMWVTAGAGGTSCRITAQGIATTTP